MQVFTLRQHLFREVSYPQRYRSEGLLKLAAVLFVSIFTFLLLFEPFGVFKAEHKVNYILICALHALSPSLIFYVYFGCLSYVNQNTSKHKAWTLIREYVHLAIVLFLTGIASFLLRSAIYNNPDNWSWRYFAEEIRNCYLAGFLLYYLLLFANSYFLSKNPILLSDRPISKEDGGNENPAVISTEQYIKTQVQQDDFCLDPAQLLFAKADGNYTELTLFVGNRISTELKRISLKQFEAQLTIYPFLFRCHRAYVVNLLQIKKVSGNAQGYILLLNNTDQKIPVSRSQLELFNKCCSQLPVVASV